MSVSKPGRNTLVLRYPASWWRGMWREGLPSGNGEIGASVYGAVHDETILLTHEALWHWGKKSPLPDVSHTLHTTRRLMDEGRFLEASWNLTNALKDRGYEARLAARFPVADLKLTMPCRAAFRRYLRRLDMETGEVSVSWRDGEHSFVRKLFVSRSHGAIVYLVEGDTPVEGAFRLAFHPTDSPRLVEACKEIEATVSVKADGEYLYYAATNDDGTDFGAVLRLVAEGGEVAAEEARALRFSGAARVLALVKLFVKEPREAAWARLQAELSQLPAEYDHLLAAHAELHGRLFHSAEIELEGDDLGRANEELLLEAYEGEAPAELVRKMWAYGRYLFISGTRPEGQPFGLYGLWGGDYRLIWGHNMANENVQMIYWHAPVGGLVELVTSLIRYYESMLDQFRENARKLYGCRGIYIPAGTTPGFGYPNQIVPVIMNWTGAAAWLSRHFYDYYRFTGDRAILVEKVLPFMRETARFYEDFLVTGDDGYFKFYPSVSPENTPQNFMPTDGRPLAHPMPTTVNATMDFALLKELLTNLIEGSREAGLYADEIERWEGMLQKIPDYQVNEDGAIREWMDERFDDRYEHRHLSHIYPVFPGQEFVREKDPERFQAFEVAVKKRVLGAQTGWSLAHMAAIYARLGDGDKALECLDLLARSCLLANFMTLHNDWRNMGICLSMSEAPVQLDAAMGWVNAVQEMLLYVSPEFVKLLPALPGKWARGRVRDLRLCTGRVSFTWDLPAGTFEAELVAERATRLTLKVPEQFAEYVFECAGGRIAPSQLGKGCYDLELEPGGRLLISSSPRR